MSRAVPCLLSVLLAGVVLAATGGSAGAADPSAAATCATTQLTVSTGFQQTETALADDGSLVAFRSSQDLTGDNSAGAEQLFTYDVRDGSLDQATSSSGGSVGSVAVDGDGTRIAFDSSADLVGDNPDGNTEIFVIDLAGPITQVTDTVGGSLGNLLPTLDDAGDRVAFFTDADLLGENPDGNQEVAVHDLSDGTTTVLTESTTGIGSQQPHISGDGTKVVFQSDVDLVGGGPVGMQLFTHDLGTGTTTQLTDMASPLGGFAWGMSDDASKVVVPSNQDLDGSNADGNADIFRIIGGTPSALTTTTGGGAANFQPVLSGDGGTVAWVSNRDLTGSNPDGNYEVVQRAFASGTISAVTSSTGGTVSAESLSIDEDGTHVAFLSDRDHTGQNADGNREVFLFACAPPPPAPTCEGIAGTVELARGEDPTSGSDVIVGTPAGETVNALGGNDRFCGGAGPDVFNGGRGADRGYGEVGNDTVRGGDGNDRLGGGVGNDLLEGGNGNDQLIGGLNRDTCRGQGGTADQGSTCEVRTGIP